MTHPDSLAPGQAIACDWDAETYHADQLYTSRSQLDDLRASPALHHARHVARTIGRGEETAAMSFGTHVHLRILEPDEWARRLAPPEPTKPEKADGRRKAGTAERMLYDAWKRRVAAWDAQLEPDAIIITESQAAKVEAIAESVLAHPYASRILSMQGRNEHTILWKHPATGIPIRVRLDRLVDDGDMLIAFDLKTTADPSPDAFRKSIAKFGYHRQAAIYTDAIQAAFPEPEVRFLICAVRSRPPFEVACYEVCQGDGDSPLDFGRKQYELALADLARRRLENDWKAEWQTGIKEIDHLPSWAYHEE